MISPRLRALLSNVGGVLADIGTDHAYLPIEAVRGGFCQKAIACDINAKPLETAKKNILAAGLENLIETRIGDGLQPLRENEADTIVIAGVGGMKIIEILSASPEKVGEATLILQPQHDLEELRRFLHSNKYKITRESIAREKSRFYVIITAKAGVDEPWTDAEYFLGKIEGSEKMAYYRMLHEKITRYIASADELDRKRIKWIENYLF